MYQGKFERKAAPAAKRKGPRLGTLVFYSVYFFGILVFFAGGYLALSALQVWLGNYEAAQPGTVSQAVFSALFGDPDWDALYDRAGLESGAYESKDTFVSCMEARGGQLTYTETSAGLSGDRKYVVQLDGEQIAAFTLTDRAAEDPAALLPDWGLGTLEFFIEGAERYTVRAPEGCTVLVNGYALEESCIVSRRVSIAEDYLPVGVAAPAECTWQITGLLTMPQVDVLGEDGNALTVSYDAGQQCFTAAAPEQEIGEAERTVALNAVKTYALYMIKKAGAAELAKYFNTASDTYRTMLKVVLSFVQDAAGREFTDETVTDYCRYSEDLFSVRVSLNLKLTRSDGSVKDNIVDQSLFFSRESGGKWLCYTMTAVDASQLKEQVRLTFRDGDNVLQDGFRDAAAESLQCPTVSPPEGKTFSGWTAEETDENGNTVLRLVFQPDETGTVTLPPGTTLQPMVLHPLFE